MIVFLYSLSDLNLTILFTSMAALAFTAAPLLRVHLLGACQRATSETLHDNDDDNRLYRRGARASRWCRRRAICAVSRRSWPLKRCSSVRWTGFSPATVMRTLRGNS